MREWLGKVYRITIYSHPGMPQVPFTEKREYGIHQVQKYPYMTQSWFWRNDYVKYTTSPFIHFPVRSPVPFPPKERIWYTPSAKVPLHDTELVLREWLRKVYHIAIYSHPSTLPSTISPNERIWEYGIHPVQKYPYMTPSWFWGNGYVKCTVSLFIHIPVPFTEKRGRGIHPVQKYHCITHHWFWGND